MTRSSPAISDLDKPWYRLRFNNFEEAERIFFKYIGFIIIKKGNILSMAEKRLFTVSRNGTT